MNKNIKYLSFPQICPICGGKTEIVKDNDSEVLVCTNPDCKGKLLGKLSHFASKNCMNIEGLSESTLEKIMSVVDIKKFHDLYTLKDYKDKLVALDGLGTKSVEKLLSQIEYSMHVKFENFLAALSIPLIGRTASKTIAKKCEDESFRTKSPFEVFKILILNKYDWTQLDGIGEVMSNELKHYCLHNYDDIDRIGSILKFESNMKNSTVTKNMLQNKIFVITGKLEHFSNRDELVRKIEEFGAKVSGSVSSKTDFLINNDVNSTSGKNAKAKQLNIPIISEEDFLKMIE